MLTAITERLARSAEHTANGCDVEHYLDELAAEALVALYPAEVDLASVQHRRRRMSEHVVDALMLAVCEREESVRLRIDSEGDEPCECTLLEFLTDNQDGLDADERAAISALAVGESYVGGGGAAPEWRVTCIGAAS